MDEFFLICHIGLESQLLQELQWKWPLHFDDAKLNCESIPGGILIVCEREKGLLLNKILKCPSKILLRLKKQKCRDIPKLYNIIKKYPWKDFLVQTQVDFKCSAKKSRLIHTKKIEKACSDALTDYFNGNKLKQSMLDEHSNDPKQTIYIRLYEDELTISLDTSGELLHIRGDNAFRGHAPIRENIASLLLTQVFINLPKGKYQLMDPMCGTGTFLTEARDYFHLNTRQYAYESLNPKFMGDMSSIEDKVSPWQVDLIGSDIDPNIIEKIQHQPKIVLKQADFFKEEPAVHPKRVIIMNPPYGKRVKILDDKMEYFKSLQQRIQKLYQPILSGIIVPLPFANSLKGEKIYFKQNGISVAFVTIL